MCLQSKLHRSDVLAFVPTSVEDLVLACLTVTFCVIVMFNLVDLFICKCISKMPRCTAQVL